MTLQLTQELLNQMYAEGEKTYPEEGCGLLIGKSLDGKREAIEFIPCQNLQNEVHEKDPERYPRDAKTAYTIDPKKFAEIEKQAKDQGQEIIAIFHSHPEHGVYFSEEDKNMAAPWGEPLFPNLSYVVISVYDGKVKNCSDFYWDKEKQDFIEKHIL